MRGQGVSFARPRLYNTNRHPSDMFRAPKNTLTLTHTPENRYEPDVHLNQQHLLAACNSIAIVTAAPHHVPRHP